MTHSITRSLKTLAKENEMQNPGEIPLRTQTFSRFKKIFYISVGEYEFCFSNEFSSFSHKTIYMDFNDGSKEPPLPIRGGRGMDEGQYSLTLIESSTVQIHESLNTIIDYQTHHRLREAKSRSLAEHIFERVNYWSIGQTIVMVG